MNATAHQTLTVIVCGAGPAPQVSNLVRVAQADGWAVQLVATAAALPMLDIQLLEALTGTLVYTDYGQGPKGRPRNSAADGVLIAPATYNTINKLALGINDTYPLNVAAEAIGLRTPMAILPFMSTALAARRPFRKSVDDLRTEGVQVLLGPNEWTPHPPGDGKQHAANFPWHKALHAVTSQRRAARSHQNP